MTFGTEGPNTASGLFFYTVAAFGLAFILGFSKISLPVRMWIDPGSKVTTFLRLIRLFILTLIECPACLGFWTGFLYGLWVFGVFEPPIFDGASTSFAVMLGLYTCGTNFILGRVTGLVPIESEDSHG